MKSRIEIKRICAWCGKEFIAYKTTTNCCSHKCGNALYKKRKRDAAIIANNNLTEKIVTEKPVEKIKDKPFLTITETAIYLGVTRPTIFFMFNKSFPFFIFFNQISRTGFYTKSASDTFFIIYPNAHKPYLLSPNLYK